MDRSVCADFGKLQKFGKISINFQTEAFWTAFHPDTVPYTPWVIRFEVTLIL